MRITEVRAYPTSFPIPEEGSVTMGIGRAVKRDAVMVKVSTDDGVFGWGASHDGRCPGAIAHFINTTLRQLVTGMDPFDVTGVWSKVYKMQLSSHGMGAACAIALSGIDLALWDIRGKATGLPLYRLLGGSRRALPAYAGGLSLGYQEPQRLVESVAALVDQGYGVVKLRAGDTPERDLARVGAVRKAFGHLVLLVDANTNYTLADARRTMPGFDEYGVTWLEEPFPPHDYRSYRMATQFGKVALAAGENHYTRFEFHRVIEDGAITILQPDLSKAGGITEAMRIAAMASAYKLTINPHTSAPGLNMAATAHFLAAIDNAGYFEGDGFAGNLLRTHLGSAPYELRGDGTVLPLDRPGIGVDIDEDFLAAYPVIEGPSFV